MKSEEHTFILRFTVQADWPEALLDDDDFDERAWRGEWERGPKGRVLRAVFEALREQPGWESRARNRGASAEDEVEIVVERRYGPGQEAG